MHGPFWWRNRAAPIPIREPATRPNRTAGISSDLPGQAELLVEPNAKKESMVSVPSRYERDRSGSGTKVFGIGLSRTGTASLTSALDRLGFPAVHFPADDATRREVYEFFDTGASELRLTLLQSYSAITDTVACCLYQALDRAYPGSKFILTLRDKESWLASCERLWELRIKPLRDAFADSEYTAFHDLIWTNVYGVPYFDAQKFSDAFDRYSQEVDRYFEHRSEQLLRMDIVGGDGWEPLAAFLARPVPDEPFPYENPIKGPVEVSDARDSQESGHLVAEARSYIEAFQRKDAQSCVEFFDDDAVLTFDGKDYVGRSRLMRWHKERFDRGVQVVNINDVTATDQSVAVDAVISTKMLGRWKLKIQGQIVLRYEGDKIRKMDVVGGRLVT